MSNSLRTDATLVPTLCQAELFNVHRVINPHPDLCLVGIVTSPRKMSRLWSEKCVVSKVA